MRLLLLICVALIFSLGLMMVFNTSSAEILDRSLERGTHQALLRQTLYMAIGCLLAFAVWQVGYHHLLKLSPFLLIIATFFLILVFVPEVGKVRNGAHRWLGFGTFTFQPSEFVKYLLPMTFIEWVVSRKRETISFLFFCKMVFFLMIPIFLVMIEPDNGTAAVMTASLIPLFFISQIRLKYWVLPVLIVLLFGGLAFSQFPYVRGRLKVYLHPELDLRGKGHQPHQAKIAAGSGKLLGRGPGASLQKLTYLPEAQNDYIAAIYAEEFGFVGVLILVILYMLIAYGGFCIAMKSSALSGCYLAMFITFLIVFQAFLNLGVVSGLLPSKGVNLPFFSQGGTSLIANIIGFTLLLNIGKDEIKKNHSQRGRNGRASLSSPSACSDAF